MLNRDADFDEISMEQIEANIRSPIARNLFNYVKTNFNICFMRSGATDAEQCFNDNELTDFRNWPNRTKVEAVVGLASLAADCKKIATHVPLAAPVFVYSDCLLRFLIRTGVQLDDTSAAALIEACGRRMRGHRMIPTFGTGESSTEQQAEGRRRFVDCIRPHLRPARLFGGGRALAALRKAIEEALPLPPADYAVLAALAGADQKDKWDARIAEMARQKADAEDVGKIDRQALLERAKQAIIDFARNHPSETFYAFSLDATMLCLNSVERYAERMHDPQRRAAYVADRLSLHTANPHFGEDELNPGDWEYQGFCDLRDASPALGTAYNAYFHSKLARPEGRVYAEFAQWLVRTLLADGAFDRLNKTGDFHIGWSKAND